MAASSTRSTFSPVVMLISCRLAVLEVVGLEPVELVVDRKHRRVEPLLEVGEELLLDLDGVATLAGGVDDDEHRVGGVFERADGL